MCHVGGSNDVQDCFRADVRVHLRDGVHGDRTERQDARTAGMTARLQRMSDQALRDAIHVMSRNGNIRNALLSEMRRELERRNSSSDWRLA